MVQRVYPKRRDEGGADSKRPQRASASKAKSSVLSQLSGLENVVFNDFIDDALDSEDVSEQGPLPLCQILFQMMMSFIVLAETKLFLPPYTCLGSVFAIYRVGGRACCT